MLLGTARRDPRRSAKRADQRRSPAHEGVGGSDIPFDEMVKLDYMYVTGWSLSWDIKLLLQTASAVVQKRGAY